MLTPFTAAVFTGGAIAASFEKPVGFNVLKSNSAYKDHFFGHGGHSRPKSHHGYSSDSSHYSSHSYSSSDYYDSYSSYDDHNDYYIDSHSDFVHHKKKLHKQKHPPKEIYEIIDHIDSVFSDSHYSDHYSST